MNLAGVVRGDAVVLAVVDQNIGIRDAGRRAVQIVDRRSPVGRTTPVVTVEPGVDLREIHGLGIDVFRTLDCVFGGTPAPVYNSQESAPDPRCLLSWKFTNVVL